MHPPPLPSTSVPPPLGSPIMRANPPPVISSQIANARLPPPRLPSTGLVPAGSNSPQRSLHPSNHLSAVGAALTLGSSTGETKLDILTTKWIKERCVADPMSSAIRGELYATYVDHMRNVHSILSGSVQMFCNTLK